jgi:polyisoprenoid-binding protein YceI
MTATLRHAALGLAVAALLAARPARAAEMLRYEAKPGSKVRLDGTSTIHDWWIEGAIIGGTLELDPAFPADPAKNDLKPGPLAAKVETSIPVRSLKSSSKKPMDVVMYGIMGAEQHPKITYRLKELSYKEAKDGVLHFESKGELTINGQTNLVGMPIEMHRASATALNVKGRTILKMTDFGMKPPVLDLAIGAIRTGDEVKVAFEWVTTLAETRTAAR